MNFRHGSPPAHGKVQRIPSATPLFLFLSLLVFLAAHPSSAQDLKTHPTPFSVWLDLRKIAKGEPSQTGLPIWIESVQKVTAVSGQNIVRLRLRQFGALNEQLQLRLFFRDKPGAAPIVNGWTETGSQPFTSEPLGTGLDVDTSETVLIPAGTLDYIDIETPGDNSHLRGIFLTSARREGVWRAYDFPPPPSSMDPFGAPATTVPEEDDTLLLGRVRATIDTQPYKLTPPKEVDAVYQFSLGSKPLLASVKFEVLGADPTKPIYAYMGGALLGALNVQFPDLADPGYRGASVPGEADLSFHYTGWLKAQMLIPASKLAAGVNTLVLRVDGKSSPVVIRALEIELKYPSPVFDYELRR
jgi:hypothetical protein